SKTTQGANEIVCELPAQPNSIPGTPLNITVTNPNGSEDTLQNSFSCDGWYQEAFIKTPNANGDLSTDYTLNVGDYPQAVSISGDTMVVGTNLEDSNQTTITNGTTASSDNSKLNSGAAYVFKRTGTQWAQEAYLKASNADSEDEFGISVGISGDTLVVGAFREDSSETTITNGPTASLNNTSATTASGAAYVFKRAGTQWVQEAYLKPSNGDYGDWFGLPVSISGDTIAVGAHLEDSSQTTITNGTTSEGNINENSNFGAAYVFRRSGSMWAQEAYLKAPNPGVGDNFGYDLKLSGDTLVVGAFREDNQQTTITNGSVITDNNNMPDSGSAYVFRRSSSAWSLEAYLKAPNAGTNNWFGHRVGLSNDVIVVGAELVNTAYVFRRSASGAWDFEDYLRAPNGEREDAFGRGVAVSGDRIAVSAFGEDNARAGVFNGTFSEADSGTASKSGAAYVFRRKNNKWETEAYLKAPFPDENDIFGANYISLSANTLVVPSVNESSDQTTITNGQSASSNNLNNRSGAIYVFRRPEDDAAPSISSVTPNQALCPGGSIVIYGSGFMKDASVSIGGIPCASKTVQGPNEIICETPTSIVAEGTALSITVTNSNGRSSTFLDTTNWVRQTTIDSKITKWMPAGITVTKGKPLSIAATGNIYISYSDRVGPNGADRNQSRCKPDTRFNNAAVIGKIGKSGDIFLVGSSFSTLSATDSGELYLTHNDMYCSADNSGSFSVTIRAPKAFNCALQILSCAGDCYLEGASPSFAQGLAIGTERQGPGGSILTLQYGNGSSGFKVWKEKNGTRILNATGLVANGWQKKLTPEGTGFSSTTFTTASDIAGRACPTHVFLNHSNMLATGRCLYYDAGNPQQRLDAAWSYWITTGEAIDWLKQWDTTPTGRGTDSSYYEGNIKTCNQKGMRLPTIYETDVTDYSNSEKQACLPTGDSITPQFSGISNGVPSSGWMWTSSASKVNGEGAQHVPYTFLIWRSNNSTSSEVGLSSDEWGGYRINPVTVRCVLP
ncbi:MAG: IPT/TIG domain-containing protein, partial [Pseudomonadota bacterium]